MREGSGFLAIWSDVSDEHLTDYLHWLTREHTAERVGVAGFLSARVFRARMAEANRFFILYSLESAGVVGSAAYLDRLNHPTPWSRRIMPILMRFARGGGSVVAAQGAGEGAVVAPILLDVEAVAAARHWLADATATDRVVRASLLEVDGGATNIATNEKSLREDDRSFAALLLLEALDEPALRGGLAKGRPADQSCLVYDQIFSLRR